jgi:hypothetical protein
MDSKSNPKYAFDAFKFRLENFKTEIEEARKFYQAQNQDVKLNLDAVSTSITSLLQTLDQQSTNAVDNLNEYYRQKRRRK